MQRRFSRWFSPVAAFLFLALIAIVIIRPDASSRWRTVTFPDSLSLGELQLVLPPVSRPLFPTPWIGFGEAWGRVTVPPGRLLTLKVGALANLKPFEKLAPNAVDRLILNGTSYPHDELNYLAGLTLVREIQLADVDLSGASLSFLGNCGALERLILRRTGIEDAGIAPLAELKGLRQLDLHGTAVSDAAIPTLGELTGLDLLDLTDTAFTQEGIAELKRRLPRTRILEPLFWPPSSDDGAPASAASRTGEIETTATGLHRLASSDAPSMTSLIVRDPALIDDELAALAEFPFLQSLTIRGPITDAGLAHLATLTGLRHLDVRSTRVTEAGLSHLAGLTGLESLRLDFRIGDEGALALARLKPVCVVPLLDRVRLTGAGLAYFKDKRSVTDLNLELMNVTSVGTAWIGKMTWLQTLSLQRNPTLTNEAVANLAGLTDLVALDLSGTPIGDDALRHLIPMKRLQVLALASTDITDAAAVYLKQLSSLRYLGLERIDLKPETLAEIQKALPMCRIEPPPPPGPNASPSRRPIG